MTSIGEALRRERLKRKLDLLSVSSELKISQRLLEAIEAEDFEKLPGGVFTRSFVRQYARLLGLDEDEIASELERMLEPAQPFPTAQAFVSGRQAEIPLPRVEQWEAVGDKSPRWSKSLPALAMVVVIMLGCSAVYAWLQRPRRAAAPSVNSPAPVSTATRVAAPPSGPAQAAAAGAPAVGGEITPAADRKSDPEIEAHAAAPPGVSTVASAAAVASTAAVRVEMKADEPVWVSVRADGKYLFSGTLQPNETRTAEAGGTVVLRLGNAGGVEISLNGKPIGPVGPRGQVRTVQLTSGGFQILPPDASKPVSPADVDPL